MFVHNVYDVCVMHVEDGLGRKNMTLIKNLLISASLMVAARSWRSIKFILWEIFKYKSDDLSYHLLDVCFQLDSVFAYFN